MAIIETTEHRTVAEAVADRRKCPRETKIENDRDPGKPLSRKASINDGCFLRVPQIESTFDKAFAPASIFA